MFSKVIETVEELGEKVQGDNEVSFVPSHAGIVIDGIFYEALASGFIGNNLLRYARNNIQVYRLMVDNPDNIEKGLAELKSLFGKDYSPAALVNGAAYSILGKELPDVDSKGGDCSEMVTRVLRAFGFDIAGQTEAANITPNILIGYVDRIGCPSCAEEALSDF
jgi:hypothetical protein